MAYYSAVDAADLDGLLSLFHADARYRRGGYPPLAGHGDLRRFYTHERIIAGGQHTIHALVHDQDQVAVRGAFAGTARSGEPLAIEFADFFVVADGLIQTRHTYFMAPGV